MSQNENVNPEGLETNDFNQKLLNCTLLAHSVYEDNPKTSLESCKYKHSIQHLALALNEIKLKYMICSIEEVKQLIVVFREIEQMDDYLTNLDFCNYIEGCEGSIHSTIVRLSLQIPTEVFIEKLLDGYDLIFTGHGLGGALASTAAVKLLMHYKVRDKQEMQNKILSIAFGTPSFVDLKFKTFIEETKKLKNRFRFYINKNDSVVKLLHGLANIISADSTILAKVENRDKLQKLVNDIIKRKDISSSFSLIKGISESLTKMDREPSNFHYFGMLYNSKLTDSILNKNNFDVKLLIRNPVISNSMKLYFEELEKSFPKFKTEPQKNIRAILDLKEFEIPLNLHEIEIDNFQNNKDEGFAVKFISNEFNTEIIISINCKNVEFLHSAIVIVKNIYIIEIVEFKGSFHEPNIGKNVFSLVFSCSNKIFNNIEEKIDSPNPENFHDIDFDCQLVAHFNIIKISFSTRNKTFTKGLTVKKQNIEKMPLDKLYLSAMFYVNVMDHVDDAQLKARCADLKKLFGELDKIWKLNNKPHGFNTEEQNRKGLQKRLKYYFEGSLCGTLVNEANEKPFADTHINLQDYMNFIRFHNLPTVDKVENEKNKELTSKNDEIESFLKIVFPTCFEIACKQLKKFNWDDFMAEFVSIYNPPNLPDLNNDASIGLKILLVAMTITVSLVLSVDFVGLHKTGMRHLALTPLVAYSYLDKTYKKRLLCYVTKNEAVECYSERSFEKKIEENILNGKLRNSHDVYLQSILINKKIRDILCQDIFIGVVGQKKGKSTFVKEITGVNTNPNANIGTYKMQVCPLLDSIKIIDFPDCEKANHRLQFILSNCILDHVFIVCGSMERAEVDSINELLKVTRNACGENFTIILNRIDDSLKGCKSQPDFGLNEINKLKKEVSERVKSERILLTYLEIEKQLEMLDLIERLNLLTAKKLKPIVYKIILGCIRSDGNAEKIKEKLEKKIKSAEEEMIVRYKVIKVEGEKNRITNCHRKVTEKQTDVPHLLNESSIFKVMMFLILMKNYKRKLFRYFLIIKVDELSIIINLDTEFEDYKEKL